MTVAAPPALTAVPPFPSLSDRAAGTYNAKAYAFGMHMSVTFNGEVVALANNVFANATDAAASANAASESAGTATAKAGEAAASAVSASTSATAAAASAAALSATSTSSLVISTGSKNFATQTEKQFAPGQWVLAASAATPTNYLHGQVSSYATGSLVINVTNTGGSGTASDWVLSVSGSQGSIGSTGGISGGTMTGALNYAATVTIASSATTDIGTAASNAVIVSGTTIITALGTIAAGAERCVTFSGALTLTHNSTSLILPGAANIATAAGDVAYFVSLGAGNWRCTSYSAAVGIKSGLMPTLVVGTTQAAVDGKNYLLSNVATSAVTAPTPVDGVRFAVTPANGLMTNTIDFGAKTLRGPVGTATGVVTLDAGFPMEVIFNSTLDKWVTL